MLKLNKTKRITIASIEAIDSTELLEFMTELITDYENSCLSGKPDDLYLTNIKTIFEQILSTAKISLAYSIDVIFGLLFSARMIRVDFSSGAPAAVTLDQKMEIIFNPLLIKSWNFKQILFLIVHEVSHIAYGHLAEMLKLTDSNKRLKLNIAQDCAINQIIADEVDLGYKNKSRGKTTKVKGSSSYGTRDISVHPIMPEGGVTLKYVRDLTKNSKLAALETSTYYYNAICKTQEEKSGQSSSVQGGQSGGSDGDKKESEKDKSSQQNNGNFDSDEYGHTVTELNNNSPSEFIECGGGASESDINAAVKDAIKSALNEYESSGGSTRGEIPKSMKEAMNRLLAPPIINWKRALSQLVGTLPVPYRNTRKRLNRRDCFNPKLCGRLPDHVVEVIVAIDTSASMGAKDIEYCFSEIFGIIKRNFGSEQKITIIECDAAIQRVYTASKLSELDLSVLGRGGTQYTPVIEYVNNNSQYANCLLVYFTDGYGEPSIPKPKLSKLLWVLTKGNPEKQISLKNPYGMVKSLLDDTDFVIR